MSRFLIAIFFLISSVVNSFAAVGCSLNDPDRDVKRIFPGSSGYRTTFITLKEIGAAAAQKEIEARLGDTLDAVYESVDVPYAYYTILKGKDVIGYIHGVNQKGKYGALQLVIATDPRQKITSFYYQRISSPESALFKDSVFTDQFKGLSLNDFSLYDVSGKQMGEGSIGKITDPSKNSAQDFRATLRGIKKDLILLDVFLRKQAQQGGEK